MRRAANPARSGQAMAAESAARRLVDRRRLLRLGMQARRAGLLVLRAGRERHRAQGERCGSQGDRKFSHQTVLLVWGRIVRVGEEHYDTATERCSMTCQPPDLRRFSFPPVRFYAPAA